ncbi:hybrid sensor histidine kinase/response regulator transcription factor [Plebeiibacterium marinum]|uniref:histidine kinase n=1 Tax=Plebeiibacterium marinum TaxID=2992111 RepID=A0AAE3MGE7_9BACT|nr:two-component regulator propeller domain-containing protein [Plebeiobacterium marinum]MCW3807126.1 ATP-binding protein [Plebeiobacterium marinum]
MKWRLLFLIVFLIGKQVKLSSQDLFFEKVSGIPNSPNTEIHGIVKDSIGYIWFGTYDGLYRYNGNSFVHYKHFEKGSSSIPNSCIRNVIVDNEKQLWVLTYDNEISKYSYNDDEFYNTPDSKVDTTIVNRLKSNSTRLYSNISINGYRFSINNNRLVSYNTVLDQEYIYFADHWQQGNLKDEFVSCYYIDDQNIIWIGTKSGAIYKANTSRKQFLLSYVYDGGDEHKQARPIRAIIKYQGQLWMGTELGGIVLYENGKPVKKHPFFSSGFDNDNVRCYYEDIYGKLWIGSKQGIVVYDPVINKCTTILKKSDFPDSFRKYVYAIAESKDKEFLWASVHNQLLRVNVKTGKYQVFRFEKEIGSSYIMDVLEDEMGNVWIATEGKGILRIGFSNTYHIRDISQIRKPLFNEKFKEYTGNMAYSLYNDKCGHIWIGTTEGVSCININSMKVDSASYNINGLTNKYVTALSGDNDGNLWVIHKNGIMKVDPVRRYTENTVIESEGVYWAFLKQSIYNDTAENCIYVGAREGVVRFIPHIIKQSPYKPKVLLSGLLVRSNIVGTEDKVDGDLLLGKTLLKKDSLRLDFNMRSFSLALDAIDYQSSGKGSYYLYKLEGFHDGWIKSINSVITFTKVPSGTYSFKARLFTEDGLKSDEVNLAIHVKKPWYSTIWALIVWFVIFSSIVYFITRFFVSRQQLKNQLVLERINIEKMEELNKEKIDFFTNVSHELRTPLTLIADPVKQLEKGNLSESKKSLYLGIISRNVDYLRKLINQILDFRKSEAGMMSPKYSICDAYAIINGCVQSFHNNTAQRNISLNLEANQNKIIGYFDKEKLNQIILNLLSNAFKYTPNGGVITIIVDNDTDANVLHMCIKDSGIGIDKHSLEKIFQPFNNEGTNPFYGNSTGIGLPLTKNLIDIMGGSIFVESQRKKGTKVTVKLPYKKVSELMFAEPEEKGNVVEDKLFDFETKIEDEKLTLLIVEDNRDVQDYLAAELGEKYDLLQAFNGSDGKNIAMVNIPDIIISDVMMHEMDGVEMCRFLKNDENTCHIPIVMLTAKISEDNKVEGLQSGADAYITKPFNIDVLKAQVDSILENRKRLQQKLGLKKHINDIAKDINTIDNEFIEKVVGIIKRNIDVVGFNSEIVANQLKISQRQLYRKLKAITGSTAHDFIVRVKMDKAAEMLLTTDMKVAEIAYSLGYTEPTNFSRTFDKHFGCRPTKYVQIHERKSE